MTPSRLSPVPVCPALEPQTVNLQEPWAKLPLPRPRLRAGCGCRLDPGRAPCLSQGPVPGFMSWSLQLVGLGVLGRWKGSVSPPQPLPQHWRGPRGTGLTLRTSPLGRRARLALRVQVPAARREGTVIHPRAAAALGPRPRLFITAGRVTSRPSAGPAIRRRSPLLPAAQGEQTAQCAPSPALHPGAPSRKQDVDPESPAPRGSLGRIGPRGSVGGRRVRWGAALLRSCSLASQVANVLGYSGRPV